MPSKERLAALLLRLLGVYFIAWGIISGTEEAIRLFLALRKVSVDEVLPEHGFYLARLAAELIIGIYFLIGGQWVFDKLLTSTVPSPLEDDLEEMDKEATDDHPRPDNTRIANTE